MVKLVAIFFTTLLFVITTFIIVSIIHFILALRLNHYLKKNRYDKWYKLTTLGQYGPGAANPFRGYKYLWKNFEDDDDQERKYKQKLRKIWKLTGIVFLALIINLVILIGVGYLASRIH